MEKYGTKINQRLGAGAFGVVFKMDNPRGAPFSRKNPIVALKMVNVRLKSILNYFLFCKLLFSFCASLLILFRTKYQNLMKKLKSSRGSSIPVLSST